MMMDHQHKLKWTLYMSAATLFIVLSVLEFDPLSTFRHRFFTREDDHKYVIVFDGGSTGTRIHVFQFENNTGQIALKDEYFEEVRPGLSSYANNPTKAAQSVLGLLERAKSRIPAHLRLDTPVSLKATAGLRLLAPDLAQDILDAVQLALRECPFRSDGVAVLDGQDEGLYAWHTLNFLLGHLSNHDLSVVSLDLGGGSTQVTFIPLEKDTLSSSPKEHLLFTKGVHDPIYTHSYLGFGLMAARERILDFSSRGTSKGHRWCVHPEAAFTWKYDDKEYHIDAREGKMADMESCMSLAVAFLSSDFYRPQELQRREIYALSYYFDRAKDLGAIDVGGGDLSVGDFMASCRQQCLKLDTVRPLLCLDCSYISALYTHALGLPKDKTIHLVTEINGFETSWALGAAFDILS